MARVIREELQDKNGNIHYFHTEDCIVFGEDGRNLREAMGNVQFEDYTVEGTEIPDAETALAGITKGKKWTALFSNIKAFCKGVVLLSRVVDSENITEDGYLMSGKKCSELFQEVNVKLDTMFVTKRYSQMMYTSGGAGSININITLDGYTPIALVSIANHTSSKFVLYSAQINENSLSIGFRAIDNDNVNIQVSAGILYVKSEFI